MEAMVLVTYATRNGSTAELAQAVAEALGANGLAAEVLPAKDTRSLERYGAVVLAAPLYMFRLHKDARRFLKRNRMALASIPVALFVPGPVNTDEKEWVGAREQLQKELARFPWLAPVAQYVVGGKFDPKKLGFPFNLIPAMKRMPASDVRDWAAIRALAGELAVTLRPTLRA
jgi:menaquinone-dependent protoporphyrinogen oxidase